MPDGVRAALRKIVMARGEVSQDEADNYLEQMDRTGRYQAETWS